MKSLLLVLIFLSEPFAGQYARGFLISGPRECRNLDIFHPRTGELQQKFRIIGNRNYCSPGSSGVRDLVLPLKGVFTHSTSQIAFFERLGAITDVVGTNGFKWVSSNLMKRRIVSNLIRETASPLKEGEVELVFSSGSYKPASIQFNEYLEPHPLGYAEWIRVVGLLTQRQALADFFFEAQRLRYLKIRSLVSDLKYRPLVLLNSVYDGKWPVPGGDTWWGQFIEDAGAKYVFSHLQGVSIGLPVSEVLLKASQADVWLNPGAFSCQELEKKIPGSQKIKAWQRGEVYARPSASGGGDDWYESGLANPDKALHELISILHPDRLEQKYNRWFLPLSDENGD